MSVRFASKKKIVLRTICFKSDRTLVTRDVTYLHRSIRTNKVENGESWQLHWASHLFHVLASRAFHFVWNIRLIEWRLTYHARAKDRARKSREGAAKRRKNFTLFLYFFFLFLSFLPFFSKFIETDHAKSQIMGGRWRVPAGVPCPSIQVFQRAWSRTKYQYVLSSICIYFTTTRYLQFHRPYETNFQIWLYAHW